MGLAKGQAKTFIQVVKRKFNQFLSKEDEIHIAAKIQQATPEQLMQWVDAETLEDMFNMLGGKT